MATITDVKDPGKGGMVTISVTMADGTKLTKQAPRNMVSTPEKAKSYLDYLELSAKSPAPAPVVAPDLSFLKGLSSVPTPAPATTPTPAPAPKAK